MRKPVILPSIMLFITKLFIRLLLLLLFAGCHHSQKELTFEIASTSSGTILDRKNVYESHKQEWHSSDGAIVSVQLIKFNSKKELKSYLGSRKIGKMNQLINLNGRHVEESPHDSTTTITLWRDKKVVVIKSTDLEHGIAFEKCCSEQAFNSL